MPQKFLLNQVKEIAKENKKVTLKDKVLESINYYEDRLYEELDYRNELMNKVSCVDGRIEILRDIVDDLKHDLMGVEVEDEKEKR